MYAVFCIVFVQCYNVVNKYFKCFRVHMLCENLGGKVFQIYGHHGFIDMRDASSALRWAYACNFFKFHKKIIFPKKKQSITWAYVWYAWHFFCSKKNFKKIFLFCLKRSEQKKMHNVLIGVFVFLPFVSEYF